jgi:hypothetical protein
MHDRLGQVLEQGTPAGQDELLGERVGVFALALEL